MISPPALSSPLSHLRPCCSPVQKMFCHETLAEPSARLGLSLLLLLKQILFALSGFVSNSITQWSYFQTREMGNTIPLIIPRNGNFSAFLEMVNKESLNIFKYQERESQPCLGNVCFIKICCFRVLSL